MNTDVMRAELEFESILQEHEELLDQARGFGMRTAAYPRGLDHFGCPEADHLGRPERITFAAPRWITLAAPERVSLGAPGVDHLGRPVTHWEVAAETASLSRANSTASADRAATLCVMSSSATAMILVR